MDEWLQLRQSRQKVKAERSKRCIHNGLFCRRTDSNLKLTQEIASHASEQEAASRKQQAGSRKEAGGESLLGVLWGAWRFFSQWRIPLA